MRSSPVSSRPLCGKARQMRRCRLAEPGYGAAKMVHVFHTVAVVEHVFFIGAITHVPVARPRHEHARHEEHVVDAVKGVRCAAPAHGHHGGPYLALKQAAVDKGHKSGAVNQRLHLRAHVGKIAGRAKNQGVRREHFFQNAVEDVVVKHTSLVLLFRTFQAAPATLDLLAANLHKLGFPSCLYQWRQNFSKQCSRVSIFSRTSVKCQCFHDITPCESRSVRILSFSCDFVSTDKKDMY
ncbi:hypothetical protein KL86DES1_20534 [uncultured Desulfovibrio sp.]|uniref:Uncharacterized protein n=1 Tax=uncultured Desulfovibrio sp. TaxID=167968 RepID=A0A212L475_9BACT|nr:hypothetical protein KL86DES1_20534 [uncultured Desulfovibrio sp.]VZH33438.1 conserved protein of unknown function [Desulfovibrio sp. 86]